ncbi:MAG: C4-dicarboxylate ABC transporter [Brevundimonas sp. 12-68-7]|nr:MAG: C4-dicarboxylate ABC transporter [Brevundimonas sp. 12-68-7]
MSASGAPPRRSRRRALARRVGVGVLIVVTLVTVLAAVAWLNRRVAAREVLVGWLDRRGIPAQVEVERLEIDGFVGRVRIGDSANPDVTVERVEVDYGLTLPWSRTGMGVTPTRIRLVRPVMRATWRDGRLSFGSLDPLIEEFTGRPPRPDSRGPIVVVETGRLRLDTEYGPVSLLADARLDDGKLMRLSARMPAASLRSGGVEARGLGGSLELTTTGDRVTTRLVLDAQRFTLPSAAGEDARLVATGDLPYPDMEARRGDGRAALTVRLTGDRLTVGEASAQGATLTLAADGEATGWVETLGFEGTANARLAADRLTAPGLSARGADIAATDARLAMRRRSDAIDWSLRGPARIMAASGQAGDLTLAGLTATSSALALRSDGEGVEAGGPITASLTHAALDSLRLEAVTGRLDLDYASARATALSLTGRVAAGRGGWPLFGPARSDDVPELAELKRALGGFSLSAPALRLTSGEAGTTVTLSQPARITPVNGGVLTLSPAATPLFSARPGERGGGALTLTATRGRGLPEAAFAVPDWRLTAGGFQARLDGRAALDFGPARGLTVQTAGLLASDRGRVTYAPDACVAIAVERLDFDENDVMDVSGRLCPSGGPLLVAEGGRWRVSGAMRGVDAQAPFLALAVSEAEGPVVATGSSAGLGLDARVTTATVEDATRPLRFNPLTASGRARLEGEQWSGAFDLARSGNPLGRLTLAHDGPSGVGGVGIEAPSLGGTSSGRLVIPSLDFASPAGPVKGLSGTIDFTNLAPLTTAPNQSLRVATLESIAPLTDLDLRFQLDKAAITVEGGAIQAAGGTVRVEPFSVPLAREPFSGVIVLDRIQLGELIAGAGFGDKVSLDAVVSGRLPFISDPDTGVRVTGGTLFAAQPGRLSIAREALTGLEAGGGGAVPPGTVEDLAYQAMENLAFDVLTAEVNSLDEGRVGVLFRIVGRHDPPQRQELRLSLAELMSREFLNRPLPLPSETGIDLTLDTTLNLNQLISDLLEVNRARNGE